MKNKEFLKYWLERNDPIIRNFKDIALKRIKNGLLINNNLKFKLSWTKALHTNGQFQTFVNYFDKMHGSMHLSAYTALKNKRYDILECILKNSTEYKYFRHAKYLMAIGNFNIEQYYRPSKSYYYYLLIRFNAPDHIINQIEKRLDIYSINAAKLRNAVNMNTIPLDIINYFASSDGYILYKHGFRKACKYNRQELAETILPFISDQLRLCDTDIRCVFNIKKKSIIIEFLKKISQLWRTIKKLILNDCFRELRILIAVF